uniref:H15 domain-containing protein n=1 Tax=Bracon brevicornis TaxID=1563983 RepID=A0A6V7HUK0_9HYME
MSKVTPVTSTSSVRRSVHPTTSVMVTTAIKTLSERNGSSMHAIKKFMAQEYNIDVDARSHLIKKALKEGVASGDIIQTTGIGASGSFKLSKASKSKTSVHREVEQAPRVKVVKRVEKKLPRKTISPKKMAKKPRAIDVTSAKSPKSKKTIKSPTSKPKTPKPKKAPVKTNKKVES